MCRNSDRSCSSPRSRLLSDRSVAVSWCIGLLLSLLLVAAPPTASAQTPPRPSIEQLLQLTTDLLADCTTLRLQIESLQTNSTTLSARLATLNGQVATLQSQLAQALLSGQASKAQAATLSQLLIESQNALEQSKTDLSSYKTQADSNYNSALRERNTWRIAAYIGAGSAVTVGSAWFVVDVVVPWVKRMWGAK